MGDEIHDMTANVVCARSSEWLSPVTFYTVYADDLCVTSRYWTGLPVPDDLLHVELMTDANMRARVQAVCVSGSNLNMQCTLYCSSMRRATVCC